MVEAQQSVGNKGISTFLSFGAKNVQPDILEKMLVGRQKTVDLLEKHARDIAQNGVNHQVFIVGPRGSGKTHILRVLYYRIRELVQKKDVVVAYFAEEEYGISGYLDFLIRIINAFMRWYDADKQALEAQLNVLRETPESRQEYVAESIINNYVANKPLLILSENFDTILEALGKDGQSKLRAWLYRHNRISIIATSQAMSPDLGREDRPFYGFFSNIFLKKLTYEESLELLRNLAQVEENQNMIEHLAGKGQAQVRAIHELIKGNHRLLVTFYEFLKANSLADLSAIFMKTMNDLKPYYETFIRFLPAQQQKILHYLALAKIPQKGTDIGKNCFIATTSLTKQLSELQRQHLIDALIDPTDKRNKLYDVSEPLLRIAIEIGEQREGITSLFIDFLALYYSHDEIKSQKARFENLYQNEAEPLKKQKLYWEVEARERALKLQIELDIEPTTKTQKVIELTRQGNSYFENGEFSQAVETYKTAIKIRDDFEWTWYGLGKTYDEQKNYSQAIKAYNRVINLNPKNELAWNSLGDVYSNQGKYSQAVEAFQKAIKINSKLEFIWDNLGIAYYDQKKYSQAIEAFEQAILVKPDYEWAWYGLGRTYHDIKDYIQAIKHHREVIRLNPKNDLAWKSLGDIFIDQGKLDEGIKAYQKSVDIDPDYDWTWVCLGLAYNDNGNDAKAIQAYNKAIEINPDFRWPWVLLGDIYAKQADHIKAIEYYQKAVEISLMDDYAVERLTEEIIDFLKSQTMAKDDLINLKNWLHGLPRFEVVTDYVNIYRRVIFAKDERALLGLPKEQRIFFEREILKRPVE